MIRKSVSGAMDAYGFPPRKVAKTFDMAMVTDKSSRYVAEALKEGVLVIKLDELICKVCNISMNGISPAESHLQGNKHKKAVKIFHMQAPTQQSFCDTAACFSSDVSAAIKNRQVLSEKVGNQIQLTCVPCNKSCTGEVPMQQHLASEAHIKKIKKENQSLRFSPNKEASVTSITPNTNTAVQFDSATPVQGNEVAEAMAEKIISPAQYDENHLECLVCNIKCTGRDSMREHLCGKSHLKNKRKKSLRLQEQPVTTTEMKVETSLVPLASSTPVIKPGIASFIPPPPQFLDSAGVQNAAIQMMKYEELGENLEDVPMSSTRRTLDQISDGELIKDIRIYKPRESLSDLFDE